MIFIEVGYFRTLNSNMKSDLQYSQISLHPISEKINNWYYTVGRLFVLNLSEPSKIVFHELCFENKTYCHETLHINTYDHYRHFDVNFE